MGLAITRSTFTEKDYEVAAVRLAENLKALREVLGRPGFGVGEPSLGAELEMCIVDENARALQVNTDILARANDPLLVQELNRFNLEYNLSPVPAAGAPFAAMEAELNQALKMTSELAAAEGGRIIAIGILPTLTHEDLGLDAMTDMPRYHALATGLRRIRGEDFHIQIDGDEPLDEVCPHLTMEGANTSFQLHLRVNPDEFAATFNAAQLATSLALAVGCNSPFYLGHKLWSETRIALFKQAVDTRGAFDREWRRAARVPFGHGWVRDGAYELFAESCLLYPILMPVTGKEDPLDVVAAGGVPSLPELRLQQGTIWSWNRAVYDQHGDGHLRIEFRALPSGPTPVDVMANAAFICGLTVGLRDWVHDLLPAFPFRYAEYNFYRAAQRGLDAQLLWPETEAPSPREAKAADLCKQLLPLADEGLVKLGVNDDERARLLGVIEKRLARGITPAAWQRNTLERYSDLPRAEGLAKMVNLYIKHAATGAPISEWP